MDAPATYPNARLSQHVAGWFKIALFNFLLAASFGALLRYAFVNEVSWLDYKAFQNAHSHFALLGWGYLAFYALLIGAFVHPASSGINRFKILFWINQLLILSIALSYVFFVNRIVPVLLMILFSFFVFAFIYQFLKETRKAHKDSASYKFVCAAFIFLGVSFIGTYITIPSMLMSGTKKILLYYLSSQFFLHFQYNGWFTFATLALLFKLAEGKHVTLSASDNIYVLRALFAGAILSFFISLFWGDQTQLWLLAVASVGGLIQLTIIFYYRKYLRHIVSSVLQSVKKYLRVLIVVALTCFVLKLIMQMIIMVPFIATLAFTIRNYVIAYLHLVFIGFVSFFLFAWALQFGIITMARTVRLGVISLVTGFILVELILFVQGTMLWMGQGFISFYYPLLFCVTVLLPLGLLIITLKNLNYSPFKINYNENKI